MELLPDRKTKFIIFQATVVLGLCQSNLAFIKAKAKAKFKGKAIINYKMLDNSEMPHRRRKWHPLQYSCLENPMDRGAWQAAVHGVTKSQTQLSN